MCATARCISGWAAINTARAFAGHLGRTALDLLLPPHCLTCGAVVDTPGRLCAACFRDTVFISAPMCVRYGVPFVNAGQGGLEALCPNCRDNPPLFETARAALRYDAWA